MAAIFTAADISGLATSVTSIIVALVGVNLIFMGFRYLKKAGVR